MKILIRNLSRKTTENELQNLFKTHGIVQSCTLILDKESGHSKGFAFIEMPKQGDAKAAIKNLNGIEINGHKIRVKKADAKKDTDTKKVSGASKYRSAKPKIEDAGE